MPTSPAEIPDLATLLHRARVVSVPMRVRFRGVTHREAVLIEGPSGWGEFSPFLEYEDLEASRWLAAAIDAAWGRWPTALRATVPVNATVPAVPAADVPGILARFEGCLDVKVKVAEPGQRREDDLDRVAAVREVLGPHGRIRVDANGGWSVSDALDALSVLRRLDLEYVEQPCATLPEMAELRRLLAVQHIDLLLAADESVRKAADPLRVAGLEAADIVVVKVAPLGGVRSALEVVQACGLPAVVSSALDTSVGIAAGVALAAALPQLPYACGLGTTALLADDVTAASLVPAAGRLPVTRVTPDPLRLKALAADAERDRWWRARLRRCHDELTA